MGSINKSSKILILSDSDLYGGASVAGFNLHQSLRANGFQSFMIVNNRISKDQTVIQKKSVVVFTVKKCNIKYIISHSIISMYI